MLKQIDVTDSINKFCTHKIKKTDIHKSYGNSISNILANNADVIIKTYSLNNQILQIRGTSPSHTEVYWNNILINSPFNGMVDISSILIAPDNNYSIHYGISSLNISSSAFGGTISINSDENIENKTIFKYSYQTIQNNCFLINKSLKKEKLKTSHTISCNFNKNRFKIVNNYFIPPIEQKINEPSKRLSYSNFFMYSKNFSKIKFNNLFSIHELNFQPIILNVNNNSNETQNLKNFISSLEYFYISDKFQFSLLEGININKANYSLIHFFNEKIVTNISSSWYSISNNFSFKLNFNVKKSSFKMNLNNIYNYGIFNKQKSFTNIPKFGITHNLELENHNIIHTINITKHKHKFYCNNRLSFERIRSQFSYFVSIGNNTRFPTLNELYFKPGGNENLKPEKCFTIEGGIDFSSSNIKLPSLKLTSFYKRLFDWILWQPTIFGYWKADNVRNATLHGASLNLINSFHRKRINILNEFLITINRISGNDGNTKIIHNPYIPFITFTNRTTFLINNNFNIGNKLTFYDKRFPFAYTEHYVLPAMLLIDIDIEKDIKINEKTFVRILFKVINLTNKQYSSMLWRAYPRRYFEFGFTLVYK
ncbi:MAG: TonB-dependent receptor plug domain-containing protein [Bacteroidales bacterium]|nr:TonB-dependent receptor plug domain-containing protein [Bacteroidales bacterium]